MRAYTYLPDALAVVGALAFGAGGCSHSPAPALAKQLNTSAASPPLKAPPTESRVPDGGVEETIHGTRVVDAFRWLEDASAPATTAWVANENKLARQFLRALPDYDSLDKKFLGNFTPPHIQVLPTRHGTHYVYSRTNEQGQYSIYSYDVAHRREALLLDLGLIARDKNMIVASWNVSDDGHYAAFRASPNGTEAVEAIVFDLQKRKWLPDRVGELRLSYPAWAADSRGFYYTWSPSDPTMPADKRTAASEVRYHRIGSPADSDTTVREPPNQAGVVDVPSASSNGRWLVCARWFGTTRDELALFDRRSDKPSWITFTPPSREARYDYAFMGTGLIVWTDEDAPHQHVFKVDPAKPDRAQWKEIIPERPDSTIFDVAVAGNYIIVGYLKDADHVFDVFRADGTFVRELTPPGLGMFESVAVTSQSVEATVSFSTFTQPPRPYTVRPPAFDLEPFAATPKLSVEDKYVAEKVFYVTADGTRAPIFLVRARSTPAHQAAPMMLNAYGGFGQNTEPGFRPSIAAWLDRGGIYAEAVIRGGGEYGDAWHRAGMKLGREKVYSDFIAATQYLISEHWTASDRLVLRGASAGGLLMAVSMTTHPELFAGVIAEVPLTDMTRYQVGGYGPLWTEEYGSPERPDEFQMLLRYSPYHLVRAGVPYPWVLVQSAQDDDRTNPMHARKFVAALHAAAPEAKVFLRTEEDAGHLGAHTRDTWADAEASNYAFALAAVAAHIRR